jgi:hypothetical protein
MDKMILDSTIERVADRGNFLAYLLAKANQSLIESGKEQIANELEAAYFRWIAYHEGEK